MGVTDTGYKVLGEGRGRERDEQASAGQSAEDGGLEIWAL